MPKMKSHSGAKKRFRFTGTGKVRSRSAKMRHILTKKSRKLKRNGRKARTLTGGDATQIKRLLPNG